MELEKYFKELHHKLENDEDFRNEILEKLREGEKRMQRHFSKPKVMIHKGMKWADSYGWYDEAKEK